MQGVENVDLFATKGLEYLLVIGYLVVLIGFWRLLSRPPARAKAVARSPRGERVGGWFDVRNDVYFHQGHGWVAPPEGDVVTVGMDDFAQRLLGHPEAIELPAVGAQLRQGDRGWALQVDSKSISMLSPVDGEVVAVNQQVAAEPELVNADPYDRGWLLKVRVPRPETTRKNLLSGRLATAWMAQTVERLRAMPVGDLGVVLPDGGMPVDGFVRALAPEDWDRVARELLLSE
jgi:glycine cleavage system H lipoate-binding protein